MAGGLPIPMFHRWKDFDEPPAVKLPRLPDVSMKMREEVATPERRWK
jgi:hypothetical protein